MATTIKLKNGSGAPTALSKSEPAFDLTNNRLYTASDTSNTIIEIGTNPSTLSIAGTAVTSTATELNILDGVTATTSEINILDGVTSTASELNLVDGSSAGTVANNKAVIYSSAGQVKGTTLALGSWVIEQVSNNLIFKYNGAAVFKVTTTGALVAEGDITAFGTA
jgi:hypothetical protein